MKIDLMGQSFNYLTVVGYVGSNKTGSRWRCVCSCGKEAIVNSYKLRTGTTKSCGCYSKSLIGSKNKTHGMSNKTRTYRTWKEMRQRCNNPNATQYKWYGGKGISICSEWNDYTRFLSDMGERPEGHTLDRIDPDKGYSKENCRWATPKQQAETNRGCFVKGIAPWNKA